MAHPGSPRGPERKTMESNTSASPRPSSSQLPDGLYKLETISLPPEPNIDIVAVHGLSEDADATWVFPPPDRTKGGSGSVPGKRDTTFMPTVETIKEKLESGVAVGNSAGKFLKNTVTTAAKQFSDQPQQSADATQAGQAPAGKTHHQDESQTKTQPVQSSNASSMSDGQESSPSIPSKVNWLKDKNMLPRYFPMARIMQFCYKDPLPDTARNNLEAVASELLRKLSEVRKGCKPGLSRPIIFIGHSFGGIVVSKALTMANKDTHSNLAAATVGLVFLGTPFQGSKTVASRLQTRMLQRLRLRFQGASRPPPALQTGGNVAAAKTQDRGSAGASTPPHKPIDTAQLHTLLDRSPENVKILNELRKDLKAVAARRNIPLTCFYEKLPTEGEEFLVEPESAAPKDLIRQSQRVELFCTHSELSKFSSPEDPNYLLVKAVLKENSDFTTTRRFWDALTTKDAKEVNKQIQRGADINRRTSQKENSLHLATKAGDLDIVKLLLEKGVEVNTNDTDDQTPLRYAIQERKYDIVRALLKRGAKVKDEDKDIASEMDAKYPSNKKIKDLVDLLGNVAYFEGPLIQAKKQKARSKPDQDNVPEDYVPEDCQSATKEFHARVTTFSLRREKVKEDQLANEESEDQDYREHRAIQILPLSELLYSKVPLSELLYSEVSRGQKNDDPLDKEWKWYHLPANNMDWVEALFTRLGVDSADGRLSGQEHRGQFPHTLFFQPQASVLNQEDKVLFMPYLHFETNEGRIRLSNAIKRVAINSSMRKKDNDATSVSIESDSGALITNDDDTSSTYESDEDHIKDMAEVRVGQYKAKFKSSRRMKSFKRMIQSHREKLWNEESSKDDKLIKAYLSLQGHRLHIRRTLDQFYYIGMEDTEGRDTTQVVQRYAMKNVHHLNDQLLQSKLIMVDQLWLWVLEKNTVITSFPQGWGGPNSPKDDQGEGLLEQIECYLHKWIRDPITSVDALASVIIRECTRAFGRFQVAPKPELQFLDSFDASISYVADRHSEIFANLGFESEDEKDFELKRQRNPQENSKNEKKKDRKKARQKAKRKKGLKGSRLNLIEELELLVEIQDVRDELNIIKMVLDDQHSVLTALGSEVEHKNAGSEKYVSRKKFPDVDGKAVDYFVDINRKTIEQMISRASDVYDAVYRLVDLKQKQANLAEARYARMEANSAAKESKTILALTIVNMIFLPLSFMASFLALDIVEFPKDPKTGQTILHLRWVAQYVFGISLAIAIPSICLAMAIGPMADFTRKVGRKLRYWGIRILIPILIVLLPVFLIALIPVAAGLVLAACGVAIAVCILLLVALIVFYACRWIWKCTPWYRRREARKRKERLDLELAAQNREPESQVNESNQDGKSVQEEMPNVKGTTVTEMDMGCQQDSGTGGEINETPQPTLI